MICLYRLSGRDRAVNNLLQPRILHWPRARRLRLSVPLAVVGLTLMLTSSLVSSPEPLNELALNVPGVCLMFLAMTIVETTESARSWGYLVPFAFGLVIAGLYAAFGCAYVPPELGGGAPRCAHLYVDEHSWLPQIREQLRRLDPINPAYRPALSLWSAGANKSADSRAIWSDPLYVWAFDNDRIVVRNHAGNHNSVQIPMDAVRSVYWIGDEASVACPWPPPTARSPSAFQASRVQ
jgi:hypothetical protein